MSRGPCKFRQLDVTRALRAAKAAGVPVEIRIECQTGDLVIKAARTDDSVADMPASEPPPPEDIVL
jgi:hypothetical protein